MGGKGHRLTKRTAITFTRTAEDYRLAFTKIKTAPGAEKCSGGFAIMVESMAILLDGLDANRSAPLHSMVPRRSQNWPMRRPKYLMHLTRLEAPLQDESILSQRMMDHVEFVPPKCNLRVIKFNAGFYFLMSRQKSFRSCWHPGKAFELAL